MDTTTLFLFEKIRRNESFEYQEIFNFVILIPLLTYIITNANKFMSYFTEKFKAQVSLLQKDLNKITLEAVETLEKDGFMYNYPKHVLAICYYIKKNNLDSYKLNIKPSNLSIYYNKRKNSFDSMRVLRIVTSFFFKLVKN
jgi:hypothetical protein